MAEQTPPGVIVGLANVGSCRDQDADPRIGELRAIYLLPAWWDRSLGRRLHDAAVQRLAAGFEAATLWVLDSNARARRFYERQGWQLDGATKQEGRGDAVLIEVRYRISLTD